MRPDRLGRRSSRWRGVVAVVTVGASAAAMLLVGTSPARAGCDSRPLVIGVRGSGETSSDSNGYGETVGRAVDAFRTTYRGDVETVPLNYSAAPVRALKLLNGAFRASVEEGIGTLTTFLRDEAASCARPIVLVGYSQGALVINRTLVSLGASGDAALSQVAAVELIADPGRIGGAVYTVGSALSNRSGISVQAGLYPSDDLPADVQTRTHSWCGRRDFVCAASTDSDFSFDVHRKYASNGTSKRAGRAAAESLETYLTRFSGFSGTWFGHPIGLRITEAGVVTLVFPEANADGSDQLIASMQLTGVSGPVAYGYVDSDPGIDQLGAPLALGDQITLRILASGELQLEPPFLTFCRPDDDACLSEGFEF